VCGVVFDWLMVVKLRRMILIDNCHPQGAVDDSVESTLVLIPTVFFKQLFRMIDRRAKVGRFAINLDYNKIMGST
jgi:hypothetical protein